MVRTVITVCIVFLVIPALHTQIPFEEGAGVDLYRCAKNTWLIDNQAQYDSLADGCRPLFTRPPDFSKEVVLSGEFRGDCHMWLTHKVIADTLTKTVTWIASNHYGGCRAGGGKDVSLIIPRAPEGYTYLVKEVRVQ